WLLFQQASLVAQCVGMAVGYKFSESPVGILWGSSLTRALMFAILLLSIDRTLRYEEESH
ncbi:MAG: hypothetical protein ACE5HT_16195, partial [Gemmatimonadales bacterium]